MVRIKKIQQLWKFRQKFFENISTVFKNLPNNLLNSKITSTDFKNHQNFLQIKESFIKKFLIQRGFKHFFSFWIKNTSTDFRNHQHFEVFWRHHHHYQYWRNGGLFILEISILTSQNHVKSTKKASKRSTKFCSSLDTFQKILKTYEFCFQKPFQLFFSKHHSLGPQKMNPLCYHFTSLVSWA